MPNSEPPLLEQTRRHFFGKCATGIGTVALASLLNEQSATAVDRNSSPFSAKPPQYSPKAKRVIYLFMAGGPSQLELFDYKPVLKKYHGKPPSKEMPRRETICIPQGK